jgi:iron(III) transport system permease protein
LIGFIFAYVVTRTDVPWKKFWNVTSFFPMISPPFLVALSAIILLGNNGVFTRHFFNGTPLFPIYGFWGLLIAQTMAFFPTAFLVCSSLLVSIDPVLEEAALNTGASRIRTFWTVLVPLSIPGLLSSLLLIFIESLADFANPLVLAGDFKVLSVEAYLKIVGAELDLASGSLMALLLLVPSLTAFIIQQIWLSKKSFVTITGKPSSASLRHLPPLNRTLWLLACIFLSSGIYLFYGTALFGSFVKVWGVDSGFTFDHYLSALQTQREVITDSIFLSLIATPFSGLLGIAIAYFAVRTKLKIRHAIEWTSLLTFAVPGTVVGIGYALAFNDKPIALQGTWAAIVLLFVFRNAPVGIRASIAALMQIDKSIDEASSNLGANRGTTVRKILMPLLAPAFISGLSFSFVRCMNSISAVIFVISSRWRLMTISIMNYFENGELAKASAMCTILVILVITFVGFVKFFVPKNSRKFIKA